MRRNSAICIAGQASRRVTRLLAFVFLLFTGSLDAAEVSVGGDIITIPTPQGFSDITSVAPDTVAMFQDMCPTNNRILAVFTTTTDAGHLLRGKEAALKRYLIAQSVRSLEDTTMSSSIFAELRKNAAAKLRVGRNWHN